LYNQKSFIEKNFDDLLAPTPVINRIYIYIYIYEIGQIISFYYLITTIIIVIIIKFLKASFFFFFFLFSKAGQEPKAIGLAKQITWGAVLVLVLLEIFVSIKVYLKKLKYHLNTYIYTNKYNNIFFLYINIHFCFVYIDV
jgi:hypothetical protein